MINDPELRCSQKGIRCCSAGWATRSRKARPVLLCLVTQCGAWLVHLSLAHLTANIQWQIAVAASRCAGLCLNWGRQWTSLANVVGRLWWSKSRDHEHRLLLSGLAYICFCVAVEKAVARSKWSNPVDQGVYRYRYRYRYRWHIETKWWNFAFPMCKTSPLPQVAIEAGHIEIVKVLVRCGADLELTMSRCSVWGRIRRMCVWCVVFRWILNGSRFACLSFCFQGLDSGRRSIWPVSFRETVQCFTSCYSMPSWQRRTRSFCRAVIPSTNTSKWAKDSTDIDKWIWTI